MGLDMYLDGEFNLWHDEETTLKSKEGEDLLKGFKVKEVTIELIYWIKSNQIHEWFVKNVQEGEDDCEKYFVSKEKLNELYLVVCEVLEKKNEAKELLPTQSGFFFGSTEYDDYYYKELQNTKEAIEKIFESKILDTCSAYYHSSW